MPTTDLAASIGFYRDGLGLELAEEWDDLRRGAIFRGSATSEIELVEVAEIAGSAEPRTALGLEVSADEVDAIYRRLEGAGARLKAPPRVRAWGMRGFGAFNDGLVPGARHRVFRCRASCRRA